MSPSTLRAFSTILLCLTSLAATTRAQLPPNSSTTATPIPGAGHDYLNGFGETVNPSTGSLSVRVPVIMPPGRGITLPFSFAYDSSGVNFLSGDPKRGVSMGWFPTNSVISQGGWSDTAPVISVTALNWTTHIDPNGQATCKATINYVYQDPQGVRHNLGLTTYSDPTFMGVCSANTGDWPSGFDGVIVTTGGEGSILASVPSDSTPPGAGPVTVTGADGNGFSFNSHNQLTTWLAGSGAVSTWLAAGAGDRNGNTITISGTSPAFNYVDTLGRTVLQDSGFAVSPETVTILGLGAPYTLNWTTIATPSFTTPETSPVITGPGIVACGNPAHASWGTYNHVVSSLTLPNGKSFTFAYDTTYGLVNKITYPTGGYVRYVWGMNPNAEYAQFNFGTNGTSCNMYYGVPAVFDRYVSYDGITEVQHQHFAYSTTWGTNPVSQWTGKQTIVTTSDLLRNTSFQTTYTYSPVFAVMPPNMNSGLPSQIPVESSIAYYNDLGTTLLKTVSKGWLNERMLASEQTTYPNGGPSSLTVYCYNSSELETEHDDYDFGTSAPTLPSCAHVPSGTVSGSILRKTVTNYATITSMGNNTHVIDKPASVILYSDVAGNNKVAETDYSYDTPVGSTTSGIVQHPATCNCGNLTSQSRWFNSSGSTLTTTFTNDDTGQRLTMVDPMGNAPGGNPAQHTTSYSYTDSYSSGTPPGPTNAYLTQITLPQTNGVNHIEKYSYAYASGEVTSSTDQNNLVTSYKYVDNLARLTETDFPDGGKTTIAYNDSSYNPSTPSPSVTTTKMINGSTNLVTVAAIDGLGHPITSLVTSDPQGTIHTDTTYDGLGRAYTVSNPYRTGSDPTTSSGTTTYVYDALGRKLTETYPDNSVLTTAYCAGSTLVTDPAGKWRRSRVDGLGRLVEVDEPNAPGASVNSNGCPGTGEPIWITSYTLDTLGNLKTVVQNGSHQRNFTYDWASRLLTAQNPESGTITYKYDSDSNCSSPNSFAGLLVSKVDARGIRTCAQYDALDRGTVLNYSNGDPTITTHYDEASCLGLTNPPCSNIGQRTSMTDAAGSESWAYQVDATNHRNVHVDQRTTNSSPSNVTKTSTYYLDLAGNVTQVVYPTGRVVNYTFNAANRPITAADGSNGITYATDFQTAPTGCLSGAVCYTPQGTFYALSIGQATGFTGLNLTHTYNNRLQPSEFKASSTGGNATDITYSFIDSVSGHNAGYVNSITNNLDATRSQQFHYDQLNRITYGGTNVTSGAHCWGYDYSYDAWGNLLSQAGDPAHNGCTEPMLPTVTVDGNNHISTFTYDPSGNTTGDGTFTYPWNAESQITSVAGINYTYDGDGGRVSKSAGSAWRLYWYGSGGEVLAETDGAGNTQKEYIYFGGQRIADVQAGSTPLYYVSDMLGTARVVTSNTGVVCYDADFTPYGGEGDWTSNCVEHFRFEGKERDAETGNDDFGARYYNQRFGRWLSADWSSVPVPVPYANLINPQTLNLYAMVADDPESFADLDGHCSGGLLACLEKAAVNFGEGMKTTGKALETAANAVSTAAKDTVNNLGTGVGEVVGGLASGNDKELMQGINTIGVTVTPFLATEGLGDVGATAGKASAGLADDAIVVRGGVPTAVQLTKGAESIAADGTLHGVSVQSANGATVEQLSQGIPNNKIGVTTVGAVRAAAPGADVVMTPKLPNNPCHCDMNGLTAEQGSRLFEVKPNPSKKRIIPAQQPE